MGRNKEEEEEVVRKKERKEKEEKCEEPIDDFNIEWMDGWIEWDLPILMRFYLSYYTILYPQLLK